MNKKMLFLPSGEYDSFGYQEFIFGQPDWRVKKWLFLSSPFPVAGILVCYFSVLYLGQKFMRPHPAFDLRKVLFVYNITQMILSCYIFKEVLVTACLSGYSLTCQPIDRSLDPLSVRMAEASWWFLLSKVCDLLDTVFFVLRKKENQLTFLHVYHHSTMLINSYLGTLYEPGGQVFLNLLVNSLVHMIMYSYYMISAMGPALQPYLWWKKYLTQLQLIQFFLLSGHILLGIYYKCDVPAWVTVWGLTYISTLVAFFLNFYFNAYHLPRTAKRLSKPFEHNSKAFRDELQHLCAAYERGGNKEGNCNCMVRERNRLTGLHDGLTDGSIKENTNDARGNRSKSHE